MTLRLLFLLALAGCSASAADLADAAPPDAAPEIDAQPCTADCECPSLCCAAGLCRLCGRAPIGLCGPGAVGILQCACAGGTCDDRHCCIQDDGTIDRGDGPICMPRDAG